MQSGRKEGSVGSTKLASASTLPHPCFPGNVQGCARLCKAVQGCPRLCKAVQASQRKNAGSEVGWEASKPKSGAGNMVGCSLQGWQRKKRKRKKVKKERKKKKKEKRKIGKEEKFRVRGCLATRLAALWSSQW